MGQRPHEVGASPNNRIYGSSYPYMRVAFLSPVALTCCINAGERKEKENGGLYRRNLFGKVKREK